MNRPEVRIIQDQQEEIKPADISQNERDMILARYGYPTQQTNYLEQPVDSGLTFEEMIRQEELKNQQRLQEQLKKANGPKPYTFGGNYDTDTIYGTDGDSGFTFKVNIVSDMPIPKKY
jgi:hypothetical protein